LGIQDELLSDESRFSKREVKSYREFFSGEDKEINGAIRRATSTGRPLGSERFIKKLERVLGRDIIPKKGGRPKKKDKA